MISTSLDLVIVGAGGHGRALADVIEATDEFQVFGFLDDYEETGGSVLGYPVLGDFEAVPDFVSDTVGFAIGLGQIKSPQKRQELFRLVKKSGGVLPAIVSPHSYVSLRSSLGDGTAVFHGAVVNVGAVIGDNCIINSMALIEHDVRIEDHCHISTGAMVNGGVEIGEGSFVGSGSIIIQEQKVTPYTFIPAGARFDSSPK